VNGILQSLYAKVVADDRERLLGAEKGEGYRPPYPVQANVLNVLSLY